MKGILSLSIYMIQALIKLFKKIFSFTSVEDSETPHMTDHNHKSSYELCTHIRDLTF